MGIWVDEGLKWTDHIGKVRSKVGRLVGILGRASAVIQGHQLLSLYNALVLPHLQYCLMVWGDFREGRNQTLAETLLKHQKRLAGIISGKWGRYHADPLLAKHNMLKIGDLYKQQLRIHAWRFWNDKLPISQAAMLGRVGEIHSYSTRSARSGLFLASRDHRAVGYRIPKEWDSLPDELKSIKSLGSFKRRSKGSFLAEYSSFNCTVRRCYVCGERPRGESLHNVGQQ